MLSVSVAHAQWLPVYSSVNVENASKGQYRDGVYASMYYDTIWNGQRAAGKLTYEIGRTIEVADHYKVSIYARIPQSADFKVAMRVDSSVWSILYTWIPVSSDNQNAPAKDTILTIEVPANSIFHYKQSFHQLTLIRDYRNILRASKEGILIDGIYFELINDTVATDTVIIDTVVLSVKPPKRKRVAVVGAHPRNVLGRPADTLRDKYYFWQDTSGRWRLRVK